ncbi:hypothetical protein COCOBI_13-2860 [Coccomyxa sp. Obi]|nr:hypothetical protein COCOBI_13-2860 [Coccomyxa sp. Obi]
MMARTSPNPSKSPVSFEGAEKEEPIEVVPENTAFTVEDRLLDVSRMERAPIQGYLLNGSASDQAPSKEGMAKGDGDESSNDADREEPPLLVSCFPEERDGPLEGMTSVYNDPILCKVEGCGDALPGDEVPSFDDSEAETDTDFDLVLDSVLHLFGVPSEMKPGAAESTEIPITEIGPDGFVFNYYPSDLEQVKQMSLEEKIAELAILNEKIDKYCEFKRETGRIMADFWENVGDGGMEAFETGSQRRLQDP